jgi:methylthioribose-1-phosphate isomerase
MTLEAIKYTPSTSSTPATLSIIDQLALPHQTSYLPIPDAATAHAAIKRMSVRGAPAIAIVAALSVAVEISSLGHPASKSNPIVLTDGASVPDSAKDMQNLIDERLAFLLTSRPTAVNLKDAVVKLGNVIESVVKSGAQRAEEVRDRYVAAAQRMLIDDVSDNERIGEQGAKWIETRAGSDGRKVSVLTHCNTGYVLFLSLVLMNVGD